jgi:hypothetical protein
LGKEAISPPGVREVEGLPPSAGEASELNSGGPKGVGAPEGEEIILPGFSPEEDEVFEEGRSQLTKLIVNKITRPQTKF